MVSTSSTTHASGSQTTSVNINTPQDKQREWIERFNKIKWRKVHPTRFLDTNVLIKQGIRKQVEELLDRMNMRTLITLDESTYPELTLQFLATVDNEDEETTGKVTFMLEGDPYSITFEKFCEQYGLRRERQIKRGATSCPIQLLWGNIAIMEDFRQSRARMSKVRNPTVRYVLRLLGNTFFARPQPYTTTRVELGFIYKSLRSFLSTPSGHHVDQGKSNLCKASEFLKYLIGVRDEKEIKGRDHGISIGGMLTPLFRSLRIDLSRYDELPNGYMDEEYMVMTKTSAGCFNEDALMYTFMDKRMMPVCCFLPNPQYSNTESNDGICFRLPTWFYFEVPQPRNQIPYHW